MASLNNRKRGTTGLSDCAKEKQNAQPEPASAEKGTGGERLPRAAKRKKTGNEGINQTTDNTSSLIQHKIGKARRKEREGGTRVSLPSMTPFSD